MSDKLQFEVNTVTVKGIFQEIVKFVRPNKRYLITVKEWTRRSLPANAVVHIWIKQISDYTGEDIKTTEARCKRDHGLAIALSGESGAVIAYMLEKCQFYRMSDEQQLHLVSAMEITRNFTTNEHYLYRNSIQNFWAAHGLPLNYEKE